MCVLKSYVMGRFAPGQAQLLYCELSLTVGGIVFVVKILGMVDGDTYIYFVYYDRHCTPHTHSGDQYRIEI